MKMNQLHNIDWHTIDQHLWEFDELSEWFMENEMEFTAIKVRELIRDVNWGKINCKQMDAHCIVFGLINALDYDDMNCVLYSYSQTTVNRLVHDFGSKTVIAILEKMAEYTDDYDESQMFSAAIKLAEVNDNKEIGESTVIHARRYIDYLIERMQKSEGDNV